MDSRLDEAPQVPGYDLGDCLGRGSSGTVWAATRQRDGAALAVKVVTLTGDEEAGRLARELSALACTDIEGLVRFHESVGLDTDPPAVAIVLDRVTGGSLAGAVAARGHFSAGEAVTVLAPVAKALAGLHAAGVVHGDVAPTNVLLERSGRPLLADLGVARHRGDRPGLPFGTEGFVAPEVAEGSVPTTASDVYAVGALAWFCATGEAPAPAPVRSPLAELAPGLPPAFHDLTLRALAGDPARRPDAVTLSLGYFDSAPCEPLRLVVGTDETSLLTQRLRQSAAQQEEPAQGRTRGSRRSTRTRPPGQHRWRRWRRWRRWPEVVRTRAALVSLVLVTVTVVAAGVATVVGGVSWPWPDVAATHPPRDSAATGAPGLRDPSADPTADPAADPAVERLAPQRDPRALMQSLADRRAQLMGSGSAAGLALLDLDGSAAMASDRAVLAALTAAGERYRDVRLSVRSARLVSGQAEAVTVEAVVDVSAYVVQTSGQSRRQPADAGEPMRFALRWHDARWRIEAVEALPGPG